jgi:2-methylcitrate dehydratase PrpD
LSTAANPQALVANLHSGWELLRNTYKPYACGLVIHPAMDGCIQLRERHGLRADDIASIALSVHPLTLQLTGKVAPRNGLEGKFSVFHGAAVGIIDGAGGEAEFSDARVQAADTTALRSRVRAEVDTQLGLDQAVVVITITQGITHTLKIEHCVGSLEQPLSDAALDAKFIALAQGALGSGVQAALGALRGLPLAADCANVARLLVGTSGN